MESLQPYSDDDPNKTMLGPSITRLLVAAAESRLSTDLPELPRFRALEWGDVRIEGREMHLRYEGSELELDLVSPSDGLHVALLAQNRRQPLPATLVAESGERLVASIVAVTGMGGQVSVGKAGWYLRLSLASWRLEPQSEVAAWIIPLAAQTRIGPANLLIRGKDRSWSRMSLRVEGEYALNIVCSKRLKGPLLVIDTGGKELDIDVFGFHARALELALGQNIPMGHAVAVDDAHNVVGAAGLSFDHEARSDSRCPVPSEPASIEFWIPSFFRAVAQRMSADGLASPVVLASAAYLDSLPARLDTSYLLSQVALEAFCDATRPARDSASLVSDRKAWLEFVGEHEAQVRSLARDEASAAMLLNKLRDSVPRPPSTRTVEAAFAAMGVDVPPEALAEVAGRNKAAHRYRMSREEGRDWQGDVGRIDVVHTLLIAAIARHVGYDGPIVGWGRGKYNERLVPAWWSVADAASAHTIFIADETRTPRPAARDVELRGGTEST